MDTDTLRDSVRNWPLSAVDALADFLWDLERRMRIVADMPAGETQRACLETLRREVLERAHSIAPCRGLS